MRLILWPAVFVCAVLLDFVYSRWFLAVTASKPLPAMLYSGACTILNFVSVVVCIDDYAALAPAVTGHMLGTYLAMRWHKQ